MGASWLTTLFGSGAILTAIIQLILMTIEENGLPHDPSTWANFAGKIILGLGVIFSKSFNVSNSQSPAAPMVVPPAAMEKPNPAATQ